MRIGIDARLAGLEHTGIGRYVLELVRHVLMLDSENEYVLFVRNRSQLKVTGKASVVVTNVRHYTLQEQFVMPQAVRKAKIDFLHVPHFNVPLFIPVPYLVTIHDLLWHEVLGFKVTTLNPLMYAAKYAGYRLTVRQAVQNAQRILTPSLWVKQQLLERFPLRGDKILVTHEGASRVFVPRRENMTLPLTVREPFIVYTGSLYPHKNLSVLLNAVARLNRTRSRPVSLVLVSARSVFTEQIKEEAAKLGVRDKVIFAGFLKDSEVVELYHRCLAVVQPSTSEGFGLTGLEAMAAGAPVIASHSAALPEIYEEGALYFPPSDTTALVSQIKKIATDTRLRKSLVAAGRAQVKKYSWQRMGQETLKAYTEIGKELGK